MTRLLLLFLFCNLFLRGQYEQNARNSFLHRDILLAFDYLNISDPNVKFHSSFKPYLSSTFIKANPEKIPFRIYPFNNQFLSRTFNEKPERRNWFNLQIHPIVEQETGYDSFRSKIRSSASGGLHVKLNINDDFTFAVTGVAGQVQPPFFLDTLLRRSSVLPEFGQTYPNRFNNGFNFFDWQGYISYSPNNNRIFNFQAGRGKHFIGDGYRSVLLSDFAPAYPYFRINTNVWRFQYSAWYTWMYDITSANAIIDKFRNKYGTFHYLSYNITKNLNVGLFENIVWRGTDTNQVRNFEINYLNPIIFFRPVEYSVGSPDNSFLGMNLNATIKNKFKFYGQIGLDEFFLKEIRARRGWWANKQAWQLGFKYINAFLIKGLSIQAEYNQVRPYTYTHGVVDQNYGHYGFALAHPLGANFKEMVGSVVYRRNRSQLSLQVMLANVGRDSASARSNVGQNIFLSYVTRPFEYGHKTGQGVNTNVLQSHLKYTYHILPAINLRFEAGYVQRTESTVNGNNLNNPYFYLSLSSAFWNSYRDF